MEGTSIFMTAPPRVSIVGAGYVGIVTGACLASIGVDVMCVDSDEGRVNALNAGVSPIYEAGLEALLGSTLDRTLRFTTDIDGAVAQTDLTLIAVGTPSTPEGIDLRQIRAAVRQVGEAISKKRAFHSVVVKSTVVPGTTDTVVTRELESAISGTVGVDFGVGVNPEFLTEGTAVEDFLQPDRIVIGADDGRTAAMLRSLYAGFPDVELIVTNCRTAEMIKYASNALLATAISFTNELANLGAALGGIDTVDVMRGVHASRYLTTQTDDGPVRAGIASFFMAGCGFGGSCLPKDVTALAAEGHRIGLPMPVLDAVLDVNIRQPSSLIEALVREFDDLSGRRVGVLGLAFKPDTNDTRESPSFPVIRALVARGASVLVHDPIVTEEELPEDVRTSVEFRADLDDVVSDVDALVLVTSWAEYRDLPHLLEAEAEPPLLVDGRRMIDPEAVPRYAGVGRS
jgi:UDPglucose 6-dehydrogenase/GDP-mannose 6-dehydrogenase